MWHEVHISAENVNVFAGFFFGPRGHRQLRPGQGGGEAGVFYSLLLYLVPCT